MQRILLFVNMYYQGDSSIEYCIGINTFLKYDIERICNDIPYYNISWKYSNQY